MWAVSCPVLKHRWAKTNRTPGWTEGEQGYFLVPKQSVGLILNAWGRCVNKLPKKSFYPKDCSRILCSSSLYDCYLCWRAGGKNSSYPEARFGEAGKRDLGEKKGGEKEKTVLWHLEAESRRSCALLQIFTFHPFLVTLFSAAVEGVPCLLFLLWFISRWHIEVEIFLSKPEGRIWGLG